MTLQFLLGHRATLWPRALLNRFKITTMSHTNVTYAQNRSLIGQVGRTAIRIMET
jgi:hypothetical protein